MSYAEIMKDYEEATAFLGMWGRFQQIMFFLLCICIIPNGIITFSSVFLADTPHHSCLIPDVNLTQDWLNSTIPTEVHFKKKKEDRRLNKLQFSWKSQNRNKNTKNSLHSGEDYREIL